MPKPILILLMLVLLAGCSGDETTTSTTTTVPSLPVPTFAPDTSMAKIQQAGRLKVGMRFDQAGFSLRNQQTQTIEGFDVEVAKLIAQGVFGGTLDEAAAKVDYVETVALNRAPFIQNGSVDVVVSTYAMNDQRNQQVDFAGPYYTARGDILLRQTDNVVRSLADLNGQSVCVQRASVYEQALRRLAPQATVVDSSTLANCLAQLRNNSVVGVLGDSVTLAGLEQSDAAAFKLANTSYAETPYGIGSRDGDAVLQSFLTQRLAELVQTGELTAAFDRTLGRLGLPTPQPPLITTTTTIASIATSTTIPVAPPS